jgi:diguanylate cyclase
MLGESLEIVADAIEVGDSTPPDVTSTLSTCRQAIAAGREATALSPLTATCFTSLRRFIAHARAQATAQRAQVTALVGMVRETVTTIAGSHTSLHETLTGSAERFDEIARLDNLQDIQARLVDEVATLKRIAIERKAAWEQTLQEFGRRVNGLESQLDTTRREATTDPLTNVANRRVFDRTCRAWMGPNRPPFVMAMIDVDDFKSINDKNGHAAGDKVLVAVAETLVKSLRPEDLVARLGGDEFAVLAAPLTLQQAQERFAILVGAIGTACRPFLSDGKTATVSIGLAEFSAGDSAETLQKRADQALYDAKRNGKGRVAAKAMPFVRDLLRDRRTARS